MEVSIDVAICYPEVVKEGFSEIRRKVVTQDMARWGRMLIRPAEAAGGCLRCVTFCVFTCSLFQLSVVFRIQLVFLVGN